jgi:hypothetical protein
VNQNYAKIMSIALGLAVLVCVAVAQESKDAAGPVQTYRKDTSKADNESAEKAGQRVPPLPEKKTSDGASTEPSSADNEPAGPGGGAFPDMKRQPGQTPLSPQPTSADHGRSVQYPITRPGPGAPAPLGALPGKMVPDLLSEPVNVLSGEGRLAQDAEHFARSIGAAKSQAEKDKLVAQLSEILEKQFDFRQRRHESEIAQLEAQVRKLRELVQKRQENRREIIARRLDVIVRDAEGLGW